MTGNSALQELFDACGTAELVADGVRSTATALHHGANDWSRALRRAGITRGDRVVCALPNGAAFVQLLVAALADGVTLVPVPATEDVVPLLDTLDARIAIAQQSSHRHVAVPSRTGGPPSGPIDPRRTTERSDSVAFVLRSSGTSGTPRWIALSETGVMSVLQSHLPLMAIDGACSLAVLPWHHAFGLILGLLPSLLRARRIVTVPPAGQSSEEIITLAQAHGVTYLSMVPLTAMRLGEHEPGRALLQALHGGLVGGAPINAALASLLSGSRLRVGYGMTEASPGIMLGEPGQFRPAILGRPVGCEVRIDADGVLAFRGPNACSGYWDGGHLQSLDADRWQRTDDFVALDAGTYVFVGRASQTFKLSNGRLVDAPRLEAAIRTAIPRIIDIVLASDDSGAIRALYSTVDALPTDAQQLRGAMGALGSWLVRADCVGTDAWVRTLKGDIDRRSLPAPR